MVQALAIRQAIRIADYVLLALLGFVCYKGIVLMMGLDSATATHRTEHTPVEINFNVDTVDSRSSYDRIIESRMFGPAGEFAKPDEDQVTIVANDTNKETDLPLRLHGAMATVGMPTDPKASAFISNAAARTVDKSATYWIDDEIMNGVRLLEVYPRRVKIINNNSIEWLSMEKNLPQQSGASARARIRGGNLPNSSRRRNQNMQDAKLVTLSKEETYQEMMGMDYAETIRQLRPQIKYDDKDNVIGVSSDYFDQIPLAQKTGFMNGDIITEVNGTPITSQESVLEIFLKEENATSVRIRFERNGRPMVRTIRLE